MSSELLHTTLGTPVDSTLPRAPLTEHRAIGIIDDDAMITVECVPSTMPHFRKLRPEVQTCDILCVVWKTILGKILIESVIKVVNAQRRCSFYFQEPCTSELIKFMLYTSDQPNQPPILLDNFDPIVPIHVNLTYQTKLIVPGYAENIYFHEMKSIRDEYLKQSHTNVLAVDWLPLSRLPCYTSAAFHVKLGGKCTAAFLEGLQVNHPEFNLRDVHVIGLSLGAHLPSFVSDALKKSLGVQLVRITGLDPALPLFRIANRRWKLDPTDADFVDVIHTNNGGFGKYEMSGHADFYVNGGQMQPSCRKDASLCSHLLALTYFTESISSQVGFWTTRYASDAKYNKTQILMGEHCPSRCYRIVQDRDCYLGSDRGFYEVQTFDYGAFTKLKPSFPVFVEGTGADRITLTLASVFQVSPFVLTV
ncbi:endothelial lipase-like [Wyeomyia smithii]|uniref:endothelial lipase-like n=1 Tax=Wyeomyia smithii TaxID=174621 RepID=UPI002467F931|nr:endothelial lipase-like [Wyeomyia smithii]